MTEGAFVDFRKVDSCGAFGMLSDILPACLPPLTRPGVAGMLMRAETICHWAHSLTNKQCQGSKTWLEGSSKSPRPRRRLCNRARIRHGTLADKQSPSAAAAKGYKLFSAQHI
ncbi:unnamed protein product [Pleuronectes platessa]|uniref:Uncharacterized protein n=1 Tax=Pleuronectes platessa TaxID=8262 RepID=A0A9N7UX73_PLEPL|nr:unnamed protein product [Pleuronectes platessa]